MILVFFPSFCLISRNYILLLSLNPTAQIVAKMIAKNAVRMINVKIKI
jgi:hypothetical protein